MRNDVFDKSAPFFGNFRLFRLVLVLAICMLLSACFLKAEVGPPPAEPRSILVMDLRAPANYRKTDQEKTGWWFSARTKYYNPWVGARCSDSVSQQLASISYLLPYERNEFKICLSRKKDRLKREFPGYSEDDYYDMLLAADPVGYARELQIDYICTGEISDAYTSYHRFFQSMYSRVDARLELWDAKSGERVFNRDYKASALFAPQKDALDKLAAQVAKDLDRNFFRNLKNNGNQ
ncbi:MAG: hypothetical protein ACLFUS_15095 [Candidatus Sumerlaeia bacterium]